ncbi:MAG: ferritin family protein [Candidatus Aminicenantes bacterium]|nr:ferritin family protein [Candidatus Aminicenantes bacterium]
MTDLRFGSIEEIVAFAIRRESDAAEGYAAIASRAETPGLRELADDLRRQEEEHRRILEGLTPDALRDIGASFTPDLHIVDALAEEKLEPDMSLQELLIAAAKKEAQAAALYESLARLAGGSDHQGIFLFLAGQEREHKHRIEAEYESQVLKEN